MDTLHEDQCAFVIISFISS